MKRKKLNSHNRHYVSSEAVTYINYSPVARVLEIQFTGGDVYHYLKVEPEMWDELQQVYDAGDSLGAFVNERIKPLYDYVKLEE